MVYNSMAECFRDMENIEVRFFLDQPNNLGVLSVSRRPALEAGGRWGGTSHPDQFLEFIVEQ